jgi:hypothetical protein
LAASPWAIADEETPRSASAASAILSFMRTSPLAMHRDRASSQSSCLLI